MPKRLALLAAACVLAGFAFSPSPASAALPPGELDVPESGSFLYLNSQPGDGIGGGVEHLYTSAESTVSGSLSFDRRSFSASAIQGPFIHWWFIELAAPLGGQLSPGAYEGALRWPFQPPESPGLSIFGDGRGCNTLTGRFDVNTVSFAPTGELLVFEADFEQHCEGNPAALHGRIRIENPPPPPDVTPPTLVLPTDITAESPTGGVIAIGYSASAHDDRDPAPGLTCDPPSGALFAVGATTVTCVATDASGNSATGSFLITVLPPLSFGLVLDATGSVQVRSGVASLSGRVECSRPLSVWLSGDVTQVFARRVSITGSYALSVECSPPSTAWSVAVSGTNGRFGAGAASVRAAAAGCELSCHHIETSRAIRLRP
jgi:HYR domain